MAGSTATCAGASDCNIKRYNDDLGKMGVAPGTAFTGKFKADFVRTGTSSDSAVCAASAKSAWNSARLLSGGIALTAELGGRTLRPGIYTHASAMNIAVSGNPTLTLDGEGAPNAEFIFIIGTTLTTCALSEIKLINGAKPSNVYWILGTALTMGAGSTLRGNVLAGTAITIGTNGQIKGRALAQTAVTCETGCTVETGANPACNDPLVVGKYEVVKDGSPCITDIPDSSYDQWSCISSTAACTTVECVQRLAPAKFSEILGAGQCPVRKN
jgi:hypothetical protein